MSWLPRHPVTEPGQPARPLVDDPAFCRWCFLAVIVVFLVLGIEHLRSDFWMDELITLWSFVLNDKLDWQRLLTSYPIANNHILFSELLWWWMHLPGIVLREELVRFPCLLVALGAIVFIYRQGRQLFGPMAGLLLAIVLAFSPIYLAFFWQLRGYGLSIFLALVATAGALHLVSGRRAKGLAFFLLGALPLPGVVPTNVLVNVSLAAFVAIVFWRRGEFERRLDWLAFVGLGSVAGMLLYVPIWGKFVQVARDTGTWDAGWLVAAHWLLAFAAHAGLFMLGVWLLRRQPVPPAAAPGEEAPPQLMATLPWLALCCAVPMVVFALVMAPWPRALLAYLAPLTFVALIGYRSRLLHRNLHVYVLLLVVSANVLVSYRLTHSLMRQRLLAGEYPQNLLQQFYTRNNDVFETARFLYQADLLPPELRLFIDVRFYLTLDLTGERLGFGERQWGAVAMSGGEKYASQPSFYQGRPHIVLGYNAENAARDYAATVGHDAVLEPLDLPTPLTVFRVVSVAPSLPRPPTAVPPRGQPTAYSGDTSRIPRAAASRTFVSPRQRSGPGVWQKSPPGHPDGMPAGSRWLSEATPPESAWARRAHPGRGDSEGGAVTPAGVRVGWVSEFRWCRFAQPPATCWHPPGGGCVDSCQTPESGHCPGLTKVRPSAALDICMYLPGDRR